VAVWPDVVEVKAEAWLFEGFETSHGRVVRTSVSCDWGRLERCSVVLVTLDALGDVPAVSMDACRR
jgi:hypothetical protein